MDGEFLGLTLWLCNRELVIKTFCLGSWAYGFVIYWMPFYSFFLQVNIINISNLQTYYYYYITVYIKVCYLLSSVKTRRNIWQLTDVNFFLSYNYFKLLINNKCNIHKECKHNFLDIISLQYLIIIK